MDTIEVLSYEMLVRVRDFGVSRTMEFPAGSRSGQLFTEVAAVVAELSHQAIVQTTSAGGTRVSSAAKARLRVSLRKDLRAYCQTARVITADDPDMKKKFLITKGNGDQHLIHAARAFLENAEPFKAEFPTNEIPAALLAKFKSDIDEFEAAISERNQNRESRVKATAQLRTLLSRGIKAVQKLDVNVRNTFRADTPSVSAWEIARHVERHNGKSRDQEKPGQPNVEPGTTGAKASGASS